ncbi:MAG: type II secretion system GspH family protein, partial [Muribaculaceae bacterium]|nr:type II secretion system GspH family protein [Muribaculaceae bacterium]
QIFTGLPRRALALLAMTKIRHPERSEGSHNKKRFFGLFTPRNKRHRSHLRQDSTSCRRVFDSRFARGSARLPQNDIKLIPAPCGRGSEGEGGKFEHLDNIPLEIPQVKAAFTLAEVLITLGIIGVVAAMTIPNLMSKIQKRRLETQVKATYSVIQQTMRNAEGQGADFQMAFNDYSDAAMKEWFETFIVPGLKVESVCYNKVGCWHKKGEAKELNGGTNPWDVNVGWGLNIITFTIAKGAWFNMDGHAASQCRSTFGINTNSDCLVIYFDVNGSAKPNRVGKDIYAVVQTDKGLVPAGADMSKAQIEANCTTGRGYWCLQKVINEGWVISDKVLKR